MRKYPELASYIDATLIDNMENDFIQKTGAWPEGYFFTDKDGAITWKCTVNRLSCNHFAESAKEYLNSL